MRSGDALYRVAGGGLRRCPIGERHTTRWSIGARLPGGASVSVTTFATFSAVRAGALAAARQRFGAAPARVALLMTAVFVPLAIAPLAYGAILRRFSAQRLLVGATALLGALQLAGAAAPSLTWLLVTRALGGLLFPAILTAAVTYCSGAGDRRAAARRVSTYVATTILGGLAGRSAASPATRWAGARRSRCGLAPRVQRVAARDAPPPSASGDLAASRDSDPSRVRRRLRADLPRLLRVLRLPERAAVPPSSSPTFPPGASRSSTSATPSAWRSRSTSDGSPASPAVRYGSWARRSRRSRSGSRRCGRRARRPDRERLPAVGRLVRRARTLSGDGLRPDEASLVNGLYIAIYYAAGATGSVLPLALYQRAGWTVFVGRRCSSIAAFVPLAALARR